ncbi:hypothetical protein [Frankia canadensis]|uniref:hypothetical protein n=1 Tax=Frankia canadensis TaxID=1836972 RepID=UPI0014025BE0|nr:hypothetical protein [Frankia canadensis]
MNPASATARQTSPGAPNPARITISPKKRPEVITGLGAPLGGVLTYGIASSGPTEA